VERRHDPVVVLKLAVGRSVQVKMVGHDGPAAGHPPIGDQYLTLESVFGDQHNDQTVGARPLTSHDRPPAAARRAQRGQPFSDFLCASRGFRPTAVSGRLDKHRQPVVVLRYVADWRITVRRQKVFTPHPLGSGFV